MEYLFVVLIPIVAVAIVVILAKRIAYLCRSSFVVSYLTLEKLLLFIRESAFET